MHEKVKLFEYGIFIVYLFKFHVLEAGRVFLRSFQIEQVFSKTDWKKFQEKAQRAKTGFSILFLKRLCQKKKSAFFAAFPIN